MSATEPPRPIQTGACCDWPLGCDADARADYLARDWYEARDAHARDLTAAGWVIDPVTEDYYCPRHAKELR